MPCRFMSNELATPTAATKVSCALVSKPVSNGLLQDGYQKAYFVLESFEEAVGQLRAYCKSITPPDIVEQYLAK